ncbi:hypothetical protein OG552_01660 [Streptomyces sp. NBC_01476]|uniref:hypothetical protein n=1 Tax=Streptomyces sp. NBC_01476 TaxID=2903881 RepID=UPI002E327D5C|nr:hypothetical protein [Streptomyces sp. NBC_01476]
MDQPVTIAWQYVVGLIFPEDLPMAAAHVLAAGYDSPSLRDLAGRSRRTDTEETAALFEGTTNELGVRIPDDETAERCLLHHMATRLCTGAVSPRDAAARVWQGIACLTAPEYAFVQAVGEEYYLDHLSPEDFRTWENAVRLAAEALARTAFPLAR